MWTIALKRFALLVATCLLISLLAFTVPYMQGGDPVRTILQSRVADVALDAEAVEALRISLGLDQPLYLQYLSWLNAALHGNFGYSFVSHTPVGQQVLRSLGVSFTLAMAALGLALLVALPAGTLAALKPGGRLDNLVTFVTQSLVAIPEYWLAPIAVLVFSLYLGLLPSAGWQGPSYAVLPALVLSLRPMAYFTRVTRAAMIDVLQAPYITAALSRGLSMRETVMRHGLRNGSMPVVTLFALWLAGLLGGSVVVEVIFAIPGMGRLIYEGVINNDVPVLQASFMCIVVLSIVINTIADILYILMNPAVRMGHVH
ncbi:ABC transporter permease [Bosea vaviloviae]|uniref:ABC transporter permease n=1 Tax=Bosea vaviloviae TaxID=1526658 RepID=A0A1D7U4J0_9HYPH|nr:ABC transporter permease [Bosea vaviloviae]AOO82252.1 ABC transporter permease [Bosea vaviloviae]